jgi:predicted HTH transcriptional regulator
MVQGALRASGTHRIEGMNMTSAQKQFEFQDWATPRARHNAPETSHEAAESVAPVASRLAKRVYEHIKDRGGLTCFEVEEITELSHQTASARITELRQKGLIKDSGQRRLTGSGRKAVVWVVAS